MKDRTLTLDAATRFVTREFLKHGASRSVGLSVAKALVAAEADGLKGHGLQRVPTYLVMMQAGKAKGAVKPTATRPRPGVLVVDAADGFAYPALDLALKKLPAIARKQGIAAASITRSNHCGVAGHHVEKLAEQGLVAMLFANTPAAMAPAGGKTAVYGTNPIAFAAPLEGRPPVVVDLSLSKVARGNLVAARQKGEPIPLGWALDPDGNPTTDAAKGIAGTMLPLGGAKGAALAFMVEALAAAVVGTHFAFEASSFLDASGPPPRTGQLIIAIDPAAMGHARFGERMATLAHAIESQSGARLSGMRRMALREKAMRDGITIPGLLLSQINAVSL
ncbi:MAG: Ldh family oxidoreductase [Beijerinckiaceae bacterium]